MSIFVVDVEADGPCAGLYSMVCFGAVRLGLHQRGDHGFYGETAPLFDATWRPEALGISGFTRAEHEQFSHPISVMYAFKSWIEKYNMHGRPIFVSDNPAFDWQFINYYFHAFVGENPFGFSARCIGDYYAGLHANFGQRQNWKRLRKTKHTHNPLDDARGNAEALDVILNTAGDL